MTDVADDLEGEELADSCVQERDGLTLNALKVNDRWVTLNNRTLAVAHRTNLLHVHSVDAGPGGLNKLNQLLRNADLVGPVAEAIERCP